MKHSTHKQRVQEAFRKQARAYAASPDISDRRRLLRLVNAINPDPNASVLEVATGPGYVAMAFAERCRRVVGVDLTDAPLAIAEELRHNRGFKNVTFQLADADQLPFSNGEFDVVVCRLAIHHFDAPQEVLREMTRVCRTGGIVAIEDLTVSEHRQRAEYQNRYERLRDPSHVRAHPISELLALIAANNLEVQTLYSDQLTPAVERWLANAQTPGAQAAQVRKMIKTDEVEDLTGTRPFRRNGELLFNQRTVAIISCKLKRASDSGS